MKGLHYRFYRILRKQVFRAHHCHKIERRAREVVKAVKKNNGDKPVLRKLIVRLDQWDYKLDVENETLRIAILNNEWVKLKLQWYSYLDRCLDEPWRLKEILISYRNNEIWTYFIFEKHVELQTPKTIMGIDINFYNISYTIIDLKGLALRGLNLLTRDVGSRGFMGTPKAPDQMQTQEGIRGKLVQVLEVPKMPKI